MKKYKISEISKILNIPIDTIRYYESKGIITPERDPDNSYRYFGVSDINQLLNYKKYRSIDLSGTDIEDILQNDTLYDYISRMKTTIADIEKKKAYYSAFEINMKQYVDRLNSLPDQLNKVTPVVQEPFYYFIYSKNGEYEPSEVFGSMYSNWRDYYVFIQDIRFLNVKFLYGINHQQRGFMLLKQWADLLPITVHSDRVFFCDSRKALHTIIKAANSDEYNLMIRTIYQSLLESGYVLSEEIMTGSVVRVHEDNTIAKYYDVWFFDDARADEKK